MLVKLQEAQCCDHLPGESVAVPNHPLSEKSFPDIQPEPPVSQLQAISLGPVTVIREKSSAPASLLPVMRKL